MNTRTNRASRKKIRVGDATVEVHCRGKDLLGLGKVWIGRKLLRSDRELIRPGIQTPDGLEAVRYELVSITQTKRSVRIRTRPVWRAAVKMEWLQRDMHELVNTASWSDEIASHPSARLDIVLKPSSRTVDGRKYRGFRYGFSYRGSGRRIYQILDRATWELDGNIAGDHWMMKTTWTKPVVHFRRDTVYCTQWFAPGWPPNRNPYLFQFVPLYAHLQGFTYQYDGEGTLLTVHERPSHVRSLFQRRRRSPVLLHFNQFCFDLTDSVDTPPREILYAERPDGADETSAINHYLRVRDFVFDRVHGHYGTTFQPNRMLGKIESWDLARMDRAEDICRAFEKWGFRRAFLQPLYPCPTTEIHSKVRAPEGQELSDYVQWDFGNICSPLSMDIAPDYGGDEGFARLMKAGKRYGVEFFMWFGCHFSPYMKPPFEDFWARDPSGQRQRNNYEGWLLVMNLANPEVFNWVFDHFRKYRKLGLAGLFRDSHWNMCADTIHFQHSGGMGPEEQYRKMPQPPEPEDMLPLMSVQSFHDREVEMQRKCQRELDLIYYVESCGILATSWYGVDYGIISGNEWMLHDLGTGLDGDGARKAGRSYEEAYFRGMACRIAFACQINPNRWEGEGKSRPDYLSDEVIAMNHGFLRVEKDLDRMEVLAEDRGIRWRSVDGATQTVFAYSDFALPVPDQAAVYEAIADEAVPIEGGTVHCRARRIYRIRQARGITS